MNGELLVGSGFAAVIAGFLIKFLVDFVRRQQRTIENHIKHNTEAQMSQVETNREMITAIREMATTNKELTRTIKENFKK